MSIQIRQSAEQQSESSWKWSVWLEGADDNLDRIKSVIYQLHSTFRNPIRKITDRASGFKLEASGWGQFMIYMTLLHDDGTEEKREHWLRFGSQAPSKELEEKFGDTFKDHPPTAFLSYSIADAVMARAVRKNLEAKGVSVLDTSSLGIGENLSDGIQDMINQSDFGVSIVSDVGTKWVNQETMQMQEHSLPVVQVTADGEVNANLDMHVKIQPLGGPVAEDYAELIDPSLSLSDFGY